MGNVDRGQSSQQAIVRAGVISCHLGQVGLSGLREIDRFADFLLFVVGPFGVFGLSITFCTGVDLSTCIYSGVDLSTFT